MRRASLKTLGLVYLATAVGTSAGAARTPDLSVRLSSIKLPPGFEIGLYSDAVPGARSLALGAKGTVFVGSREEGKVYALSGGARGDRPARVYTLAAGLDEPNGVAFKDGALFVAEVHRILRFDGIEGRLAAPPKPVVVRDDLPTERQHGWRYMAFGPDGFLYIGIGAPCNVCESADERFATIVRLKPDGSDLSIVARGVRNSVGFDFRRGSGELWFTDNGRDWLGDDLPPDELNRAPRLGMHFGFPYCHGGDTPDSKFGAQRSCRDFTPPVQKLGPHVAALGMRFYEGAMFPPQYKGRIFIAEHGSWNRTTPTGYRLTTVRLEGERSLGYDVFAEGWLQDGRAWGRPVDVLVAPDGALLVSDDRAGAVYRITYRRP